MKLTGTLAMIGRSGPWLAIHEIHDRADLPGRLCARLSLTRDTGAFLNIASHHLGSWVVGWYPRHTLCSAARHRCGWRLLPEVNIETHPVTVPTGDPAHR